MCIFVFKRAQGILIYEISGLPAVTWYAQVSTSFCWGYQVTAGNGVNRVLGQAGFIYFCFGEDDILAARITFFQNIYFFNLRKLTEICTYL